MLPSLLLLLLHLLLLLLFLPLQDAKARVEGLIAQGIEDGGKVVLDGRGVKVPGFEKGNFVGPTILTDVTATNRAYKEEIFGEWCGWSLRGE